jgi:hypothetical protein
MTDDQPKRERGPFVGCLASVLLLGPPVYALSAGPFVWLAARGYLPEFLGIIYWPLVILVGFWEPASRLFKWYLALWAP